MKTRLYVIGYGQQIRLIRANTNLQALDFAAKGIINVSAVKKDELADYMMKGIQIEDATGGKQEVIE
jgi:hypothetical protein